MEHRLQKRRSVRMPVDLVKRGKMVATSNVTDISAGGVGIEPPAKVELRKGELIDVHFSRPMPAVPEQSLRTVVVHKEKGSIGLMFLHDDPR